MVPFEVLNIRRPLKFRAVGIGGGGGNIRKLEPLYNPKGLTFSSPITKAILSSNKRK